MTTSAVRVVLVDDHQILLDGLRISLEAVPDIQVVGVATDGESAREQVLKERPEVVVLDLHLGDMDGVRWAKEILLDQPGLRLVMLTSEANGDRVREAMEAGCCAYVVKSNGIDELVRAIRFAREGHLYLCPQVMTAFMRPRQEPAAKASEVSHRQPCDINDRDREIVRLVALGLRNKEVAEQMNLSVKSIETYRGRLMKQLGCESPADLVRWAIRQGLVSA